MGKGIINIKLVEQANINIVYFRDTGSGISKEQIPYIFKQFHSNRIGGMGVGLSFCQAVMHSIGGDIACESKLNEYTLFILNFPKLDVVKNNEITKQIKTS